MMISRLNRELADNVAKLKDAQDELSPQPHGPTGPPDGDSGA